MTKTLFFYDLETSGFKPSEARIMQFAGQRTDLNLMPLDRPINHLIKLTEDILPSPEAILLTGITPQQTIAEGLVEAEFLKIFYSEVATNDTVFVGFNNVRFDDEFIRYLNYRNYYDPYEWHWSNGRSRWDLLDVVRMMRALRPIGINWPKDKDQKSTNRLELLTKANNIKHEGAHDALSDVMALIDLTKLVKSKQPKLFGFLFETMRDKSKIGQLISSGQPVVYTSGKYSSEYEKTTVVASIASHPKRQGELVFDLRYNPADYADLSVEELVNLWRPKDKDAPRLPVKSIQFNRLPAVAPLSVFNDDNQKRLELSLDLIKANYSKLKNIRPEFGKKILSALSILDENQDYKIANQESEADGRLYEDFISSSDKPAMKEIVNSSPSDLANLKVKFKDDRLKLLLPLYKARNYPKSLDTEETEEWDKFKKRRLLDGKENSRISHYFNQLAELGSSTKTNKKRDFILEELKLYGESIVPLDA